MDEHITYVGLDVHKETISVALALEAGAERFANTGRYRIRLRH